MNNLEFSNAEGLDESILLKFIPKEKLNKISNGSRKNIKKLG
jgi:hypothetical protein